MAWDRLIRWRCLTNAPDQLLNAIRKLYAGGRYLSNAAAEALAMRVGKGAPG
jgi:DNA-binding NarL/FixJ family response regulator